MTRKKTTAEPLTLDVRWIDPKALLPNPLNLRDTHIADPDLTASVAERGVLEPLLVYLAGGDQWTLIFGHRRLAAALAADLAEVPCRVRPAPTEVELLELMLTENLHRKELTVSEEAHALMRLRATGDRRTIAQLGAALNRSASWVAERLAIAALPDQWAARVDAGDLPVGLVGKVAKARLPKADLEALVRKSPSTIEYEVGRLLVDRDRAKVIADLEKAHGPVTVGRVAPGRWGVVRLGDHPGELNVEPNLHTGCPGHHASIGHSRPDAAFWCTTPEVHVEDPDAFVPFPLDDDAPDNDTDDVVALEDAEDTWSMVDSIEPRVWWHVHCPHRVMVETPWGDIEACKHPDAHVPGHPDYDATLSAITAARMAHGNQPIAIPRQSVTHPTLIALSEATWEAVTAAVETMLDAVPDWLFPAQAAADGYEITKTEFVVVLVRVVRAAWESIGHDDLPGIDGFLNFDQWLAPAIDLVVEVADQCGEPVTSEHAVAIATWLDQLNPDTADADLVGVGS